MGTQHNFTVEDLALSLLVRLDRRNIFPPILVDPEIYLSPIDNLTNLSLRRPKRTPNAFLVCRKNVYEEAACRGTYNMRVISKVTGILWKNASREEKSIYKKLADKINEIHNKRTLENQKKMMSSLKERNSSYKPYYDFAIQSPPASPAPPAPSRVPVTLEKSTTVSSSNSPNSPPSLPSLSSTSSPSSLIPISTFPPSFNFENVTLLKNNDCNFKQMPYFIDNILVLPHQNF